MFAIILGTLLGIFVLESTRTWTRDTWDERATD